MNIIVDWELELGRILIRKGKDKCPSCGRVIDRGDVAWNNGSTEYGTGYCVVEIQCQACDTEIAYIHSWYPEIENLEDLCYVIDGKLKDE